MNTRAGNPARAEAPLSHASDSPPLNESGRLFSMTPSAARDRFCELIEKPDAEIPLAETCLAIAAEGRPQVDPQRSLEELNRLAEKVERSSGRSDQIQQLNQLLFEQERLREIGITMMTRATASWTLSLSGEPVFRSPLQLSLSKSDVASRLKRRESAFPVTSSPRPWAIGRKSLSMPLTDV